MTTVIRPHRTRRGFTAIELMIVVVIVGIMAASVMPRISRVVAEERIRALQRVVATDIEVAFSLANREHKPVTVSYNSTTKVLSITDRASSTVLKSRYLGQARDLSTTGVSFSSTAPSGTAYTIFPFGLANGTLVVTVTNGTYTRTVTVTRAGQVTKS